MDYGLEISLLIASYPGLRRFPIDRILKREKGEVRSSRLEICSGRISKSRVPEASSK
jgi:hypothetical protein